MLVDVLFTRYRCRIYIYLNFAFHSIVDSERNRKPDKEKTHSCQKFITFATWYWWYPNIQTSSVAPVS